jgi:hypothetical protein
MPNVEIFKITQEIKRVLLEPGDLNHCDIFKVRYKAVNLYSINLETNSHLDKFSTN